MPSVRTVVVPDVVDVGRIRLGGDDGMVVVVDLAADVYVAVYVKNSCRISSIDANIACITGNHQVIIGGGTSRRAC